MRIAVAPIFIDRYTRLDEDSTGTVLACLPEDEGPEDDDANSMATQLVLPVREYPKNVELRRLGTSWRP